MTTQEEQLQQISEIKNMMERSSRFLSLSGLSGVFAGVYALIGAYFVYADLGLSSTREAMLSYGDWIMRRGTDPTTAQKINEMVVVGVTVLVLSIMTGYYFSRRKAKKNNLKMWDKSAKLMVMNLAIPLVSGGLFCLILLFHGVQYLVAPATLIFYGIALVNCSKYTLHDLRYLGVVQIGLGLMASYFYGNGLLFWAIGFGVFHIIYGMMMYIKYERK